MKAFGGYAALENGTRVALTDPTFLGLVQDVTGSTVSVALDESTQSGLIFVKGSPYRVGQVGSYVRLPLGFRSLIGVVTRAGVGAVPEGAETDGGRRWVSLELIGTTTQQGGFERGVQELPSLGDGVHLAIEDDLSKVFGDRSASDRVKLGVVAGSNAVPALLDLNSLVSRHTAIVGSTGSGKSTTVAQLIARMSSADYPSSRILMFDVHGEYVDAMSETASTFSVDDDGHGSAMYIPYWALTFDELIPLTFGALPDDSARGAVRDEIVRLKREAFAACPRDGLSPESITVDTPIPFSIHQLWFDLHRSVNATHTERPTGQSRETEALELDEDGDAVEPGDALGVVPPRYQPATLAAGAVKVYLSQSTLNIRRQVDALASRLRDPRFDFLFRPGPWSVNAAGECDADLDAWLETWIGGTSSVTVLDLSGAPSAILTDIVGSLTRVLYDALYWARDLSEGGRERPTLLVFEEAHTYINSRSEVSGSSIRRVVKEGRKYGVGAMIITQRPAEIDSTVLSQCGTIVALRLANSADRARIASAVSDNLTGLLSVLPALRTGEAIVVGEAVPMPLRALVDFPDRPPRSGDPMVVSRLQPGGWDKEREPEDYADVVQRWRSSDPTSNRIQRETE